MDKTAQVNDSVGNQILKAIMVEFSVLSPRYQAMAQDQQQEIIDRLADAVADSINHAVHTIAAKSYDSLPVQLVKAQLKDGIQFQVNVVGTPPQFGVGRPGRQGSHAGVLRSYGIYAGARRFHGACQAARCVSGGWDG